MSALRQLAALLIGASATVACAAPPAEPEPMPATASTDLSSFAWRMYRQIGEEDRNLVFSPLSIASVFSMLGAGARGETLSELRQVLAVSAEGAHWHKGTGEMLAALAAQDRAGDDYQSALSLRLVNELWLQRDFEVGADFQATLSRHYGAAPRALDFAADPDAARKVINARIASDTADLIPALLPPGSVTTDARLVLTNALYFKGAWATAFHEHGTERGDFHALDGSTVEVPMMHHTAHFAHAAGEGWQALSLPYDGNTLELLVLMPALGQFRDFTSGLDAQGIDSMLRAQQQKRVALSFPKFSLRTTLPLVEVLQRAGMRRVFTHAAELEGIADNLFVSAAFHEAVVDIDEKGTEAAAATAAVVSLTSAPMAQPEPLVVRIDRPFVFVIRDRASGVPLFIGQMLKP